MRLFVLCMAEGISPGELESRRWIRVGGKVVHADRRFVRDSAICANCAATGRTLAQPQNCCSVNPV